MNTAIHHYRRGMGDAAQTVQTVSAIATPVVLGGLSAEAAASAAASGSAAMLLGMPLAVAVPVIGAAIAGITIGIVALLRSGCGQACVITSDWANQAEALITQNLSAYFNLPAPRTNYQKSVALANFDSIWNYLVSQCQQVPGGAGQNCINDRKAGACKWKQREGAQKYPGQPAPGQCWNWFNGYRDPIANDPTVPDSATSTVSSAVSAVSSLFGGSGSGSSTYLILGLALMAGALIVGEVT